MSSKLQVKDKELRFENALLLQGAATRKRRRHISPKRSRGRCCAVSCGRRRSRLRRCSWPRPRLLASTDPRSASRAASSTPSSDLAFPPPNCASGARRSLSCAWVMRRSLPTRCAAWQPEVFPPPECVSRAVSFTPSPDRGVSSAGDQVLRRSLPYAQSSPE